MAVTDLDWTLEVVVLPVGDLEPAVELYADKVGLVIVLPVRDLERAVEFYADKVGFELDRFTRSEHLNVAQLTPHGSDCSIVVGDLPAQNRMEPGSMPAIQLGVADAKAARAELAGRGVACEPIRQSAADGGGTCFGFADPDGNTWAVRERRVRGDRSPMPHEGGARACA